MGLITLLTDYKYKDFYLAKVEGRIKRLFTDDYLLHLSHGICNFDLPQAVYNFNALLDEFSKEDFHFIFVNNHYSKNYSFVIAETKKHGFIVCPNNGILGLLNCEYIKFYHLPLTPSSFVEMEVLEKLKTKSKLLEELEEFENPMMFRRITTISTEKELKGEVIYIDGYGNCITNIKKSDFEDFIDNQPYHIKVKRHIIERISNDYSDNQEAGISIFFNNQGHLEVSNTHGNASKLLGLQVNSRISVKKN